MLYFTGGIHVHLDERKAASSAIMKIYRYNETKKKHLSLLSFEKPIDHRNNVDEYSIESTDKPKEICMIILRHRFDPHGFSKTSPFENVSTLQKLCTRRTEASCVENIREQHVLNYKGKNN